MIIDVTGTVLTPGKNGNNCLGNGLHYDKNGFLIECCCDECDYALCCSKPTCDKCSFVYNCPLQNEYT